MNSKQRATAAVLGWSLDHSPSTEMRDGSWYRHGSTYEVKSEEAVLELVEARHAFVAEFYDIWRCFYDGTCPTGKDRDGDLAALRKKFPGQADPE